MTFESVYQCLLNLATEEGINASSRDEIYGCLFGRDSAITILKILRVHERRPTPQLLEVVRRTLISLVSLQGQELGVENGEEPGKFIHEFRKENFEHLLLLGKPWFVSPDGLLKNYDSIDATPLVLVALYKYWQITQDHEFLLSVLPSIEKGLNWIITFGDRDNDFLLEYEFFPQRKHGGLIVQSWTDSHESIRQADGRFPKYPIAPVEVQAYAWLALRLWADFYRDRHNVFSRRLRAQAEALKRCFNEMFLLTDGECIFAAQALDGNKHQITTITANPGLCLWMSYGGGKKLECIVDDRYIPDFVRRIFEPDMFDDRAGVRTMSTRSLTYNPNQDSYHNGSFWPVLNGLIHEGLQRWGYYDEAVRLKEASIKPMIHFGSPIELYLIKDGIYLEYCSPSGQTGCRYQAWSAACALDWLVE